MRCDINISCKPKNDETEYLEGSRVEIKNVMGLKIIEKAIEAEINRQTEMLMNSQPVLKETRRYDAMKNLTVPLRGTKEEDLDY